MEFSIFQNSYIKVLDVSQYIEKLLNTADTVLLATS